MPTSKRRGNGGGYLVPAVVDLLKDGEMHSHLFLFHNVWTGPGETRAQLNAAHLAEHAYAAAHGGLGMQPHTHNTPKPRREYNWDG